MKMKRFGRASECLLFRLAAAGLGAIKAKRNERFVQMNYPLKVWVLGGAVFASVYFPMAVFIKDHAKIPDPNVMYGPFQRFMKTHLYIWYDRQRNSQASDSPEHPRRSTLRLFEDQTELGPAHSTATDIIEHGKGRFVHWGDAIQFSASDNSDPNTNGRVYRIER